MKPNHQVKLLVRMGNSNSNKDLRNQLFEIDIDSIETKNDLKEALRIIKNLLIQEFGVVPPNRLSNPYNNPNPDIYTITAVERVIDPSMFSMGYHIMAVNQYDTKMYRFTVTGDDRNAILQPGVKFTREWLESEFHVKAVNQR